MLGLGRVHCRDRVLGTAALLLGAVVAARAGQVSAQLVITSATPDAAADTITISGGNFTGGRPGARPFVTLNLIPLDVRAATDTVILASAPVGSMPANTYLLTVSRGSAAAESASLEVSLGAAGVPPSGAQPGASRSDGTPDVSRAWADSLPSPAAGTSTAAKVGDRVITVDDLDREWRRTNPTSYLQAIRQLDEARRQVLTTMVADELLAREAKSRGMTVEALLAEEIPKRVIAMPDSAVASLYESLGNNARGASLDQMRPALRAWLQQHSELELAKLSYIEELKKVSTKADMLLDSPRIQIDHAAQDIVLGAPGAPIEIVVFGDFQSAEYARLAEVFGRIRETFGDRVRMNFKNLPTLGPDSVAAAEAALCANAQGKFWPYHDALVAPGILDAARLKSAASAVGVKPDLFNSCVERREFREAIPRALAEADRYGIPGSPSFLINGRLAPPPPPFLAAFDYFKLLIEEELARVAQNRPR